MEQKLKIDLSDEIKVATNDQASTDNISSQNKIETASNCSIDDAFDDGDATDATLASFFASDPATWR